MATDTSYYDSREAETRMRTAAILQEAAELEREGRAGSIGCRQGCS